MVGAVVATLPIVVVDTVVSAVVATSISTDVVVFIATRYIVPIPIAVTTRPVMTTILAAAGVVGLTGVPFSVVHWCTI